MARVGHAGIKGTFENLPISPKEHFGDKEMGPF